MKSVAFIFAALMGLVVVLVVLLGRTDKTPELGGTPLGNENQRLGSAAENWLHRVGMAGEGVVRTVVPTGEAGVADAEFRSLGRMSGDGARFLHAHVSGELARLDGLLRSRIEEATAESPLREYAGELRLLVEYEQTRAVKDLIERGAYVTLPLKDGERPPTPPGVVPIVYAPILLDNGDLGQVLVWVDSVARESIREAKAALREVVSADREERIRAFHEDPYAVRRAWIDRYLKLAAKFSDGSAELTLHERIEYLALEKELQYLNVRIDVDLAMLVPR